MADHLAADTFRQFLTELKQRIWTDQVRTSTAVHFPDTKGFSPRNLQYMRAFAYAWPEEESVQAVLAQITCLKK